MQDLIDQGSTEELELLYFDGKPFKGKLILGADNSIEALAKDDKGEFNTIRSKSARELQEAEAVRKNGPLVVSIWIRTVLLGVRKMLTILKYQFFQSFRESAQKSGRWTIHQSTTTRSLSASNK